MIIGTSRRKYSTPMNEQHFDSHKVVGLTERCGGRLSACGAMPTCCNTAAESRRESALVDAKISGCHFRLLTALFQIMKYKAKEAKQRLACPRGRRWESFSSAIQTKTLKGTG